MAHILVVTVVPYVGTWIEIIKIVAARIASERRSLRGNVDRNLEENRMRTLEYKSFPTWERG